jgi:GntR family transcriptional regulator
VSDRLQEAKARRVYLVLRDRTMSGAVNFGTQLQNENNLAEAYGVSRVTVRRTLAELERERHFINLTNPEANGGTPCRTPTIE